MDPTPLALTLAGATGLHGPAAPLRLPTRKALALVALLLLEGATRRERLAQMLWPELEAAVARRNLRREVFRLREAGLAVVDDGLEALRLDGVVPRWPAPEDAPATWLQGLDGAAGAELDDWLGEQRERLHRRWIARLEADAEALARSGDGAAAQALRRHVHAHRAASGDWGAGSRWGEVEVALAEKRPNATPAAPHPEAGSASAATARRWPFVGRTALLARIAQAVAAAQVVFIDGAPGVGKTRLALEAAAALGGALLVRCRPDDAAQPFASATRLLESLLDAAPDVVPERWVRRELSPLVPQWLEAGVPEPDGAAAERRARAFDTAWRQLARENFGAIVIDDWQWADVSSLALWNLDSPPDAALPVARLVVHRGAELPPAALERRRLLLDEGLAVAVTVPALDDAELGALLQQLHGPTLGEAGAQRLAQALHRSTGGNPMFVGETLRHLGERGALQADAELPRLPPGVRETVLARVYALGPVPRALLECASLAGEAASLRLLAHVMASDALDVARAVEHAVAAELLLGERDGRVRFVHDLIAQSLAESLSAARAQALHGRIADAMLALGAQLAGHGPGRIARQLALAGRGPEACGWHLRAAESSRQLGALGEAMDQCDAALASADEPALRVQALLLQATLLRAAGSPPTVDAALEAALAAAQALGPQRVHDVLLDRAAHWVDTARVEPALALLERLRAAADPAAPLSARADGQAALSPAQAVRAAELTAAAQSNRGQHRQAVVLLREALQRLDPGALVERSRVLGTLARSLAFSGEREACAEASRERARLCELLGDADGQAAAVGQLGAVLRDLGQRESARAACTEALALARRGGSLKTLRVALYRMVVIETDESRFDAVLPLVEEGEALSPFWDSPDMQQGFLRLRQFVHQVLGEGELSRQAAARMLEHARMLDNVHVRLGSLRLAVDLELLLDDPAAAARLLDEAEALAAAAHADEMSLEIATRRARCQQRLGDAAGALALADQLLGGAAAVKAEDRLYLAAVAADAALDLGDPGAAAERLAAAPVDATLPEGTRFSFVWARLRLALAGGMALAPALKQATALRDAGHVPALKRAALETLLAGAGANPGGREGRAGRAGPEGGVSRDPAPRAAARPRRRAS